MIVKKTKDARTKFCVALVWTIAGELEDLDLTSPKSSNALSVSTSASIPIYRCPPRGTGTQEPSAARWSCCTATSPQSTFCIATLTTNTA